jgi:hypothetical protein
MGTIKRRIQMSNEKNNESQAIVPKTQSENEFALVQRKAKMLSASDLVPKEYRGGDSKAIANCIIALSMSERMGADPLMVMQNLHIIHGKPSWSSTFVISAINSCGRFSSLGYDLQGEGMSLSCRAFATELSTGNVLKGPKITMEMAEAEGWLGKNGSKWKTMPEHMIMLRSAAFFGRLYAPEILSGMHTVEEVSDMGPDNINEVKFEDTVEEVESNIEVVEAEIEDLPKEEVKNATGLPSPTTKGDASKPQIDNINRLLNNLGIKDDMERHIKVSELCGYSDTIESLNNLTKALASSVIKKLKEEAGE